MNAFMIFARRRRPQVSAQNSLLRTGEISKILSKEWTTMPMVRLVCPSPFLAKLINAFFSSSAV